MVQSNYIHISVAVLETVSATTCAESSNRKLDNGTNLQVNTRVSKNSVEDNPTQSKHNDASVPKRSN